VVLVRKAFNLLLFFVGVGANPAFPLLMIPLSLELKWRRAHGRSFVSNYITPSSLLCIPCSLSIFQMAILGSLSLGDDAKW